MKLINVRNSCRSPLQILSKVEALQNLGDYELKFKTATVYANNRLIQFTKIRTAFLFFRVHFQV